jgi:tetratricopeptide (TPR) repeat protein
LVAVVAGLVLLARWRPTAEHPALIAPAAKPPSFVGGNACKGCHAAQHDLWTDSHHALAMQPADGKTVLGNFENASFVKDGVTSTFLRRDGRYLVRTDGPDGTLGEYPVAYTFGVDPLQQYLIPFPAGRYQALSIAWDTRPAAAGGQRWFHLYPNERIDHRDVLHWTGPAQRWNYMCADCHSTNLKENYRLAEDRFEPSWTDLSVSCEACHGPGSGHLAWAERAKDGGSSGDPLRGLTFALKGASRGAWAFAPGQKIARRTEPPASHSEVETCAPCHARRAPISAGHEPGQALEQSYRAALLDDPLYYADGQIRDEVYEYGSFLQSRMYQAGVTCSDCHDPHSGRRRQAGNGLCAKCHLPAAYDGPQHHFHAAGTEGAQCVACHMPAKVYMVVHERRDHGFRVPRPDLSVELRTPNTCNHCHADRPAQWAAEAVAKWYGPNRRGGWHWAEAIEAGRRGRVDAERQLVRAIDDPATPAIARATALSLLASYLSPGSLRVVEASRHDADPLVRRAAATNLAALEPAPRVTLGAPLLVDPVRSVRFEALSSLLDVSRDAFGDDQRAVLDRVIDEYRRAQTSLADRVESHLNLGALDASLGDLDRAEAEYRIAIRQQPSFIPAYVNLADLDARRGREDRAVETLEEAVKHDPTAADAYHAMGLSLVRQKRLPDALPLLEKAATLRVEAPRYAYVYAVALREAGDIRQALAVLERAHQRRPANRDILVALVEYHRDAGDPRGAAAWARKLAELSPASGAVPQ